MRVGDLMNRDVEVVAPNDTLRAAAQLMAHLGLEALPVGQDNRLVGTITGHDIALQVAAGGGDAENLTVQEVMSADVLYCFANENAQLVSAKMRDWWVRRLPVVSPDKRLLGTVSLGDLTPLKPLRNRAKRVSSRRQPLNPSTTERNRLPPQVELARPVRVPDRHSGAVILPGAVSGNG
jgi:CBS domain-containing protein